MCREREIIVMDIDGTLCMNSALPYEYRSPDKNILEKLEKYKEKNFYIILYTSRNMNSFKNNIGKINAMTAKILLNWLDKFNIPFDEIHYGKPWCGKHGFYVDDKAIRPSEFLNMTYEEINRMINGI